MHTRDRGYYVFAPARGLPMKKHATEGEAMQEAERLARKEAGVRFYVLKEISSCIRAEVQWDVPKEERAPWEHISEFGKEAKNDILGVR